MKKVSDAVSTILAPHSVLYFGLHHRLLNLSQVARFILPLVEARTRKEVSESAVLMSLSRLQAKIDTPSVVRELVLDKINIHSGLCSLTVQKTSENHQEVNRVFSRVSRVGGFITITEGINEITAIIEDENFALVQGMLSESPRYVHRDIAAVGVRFNNKSVGTPGMMYQLLQQVALQDINIIEVTSTATEFNLYVRREDVRLAFDSIYRRFSKRAGGKSDI